MRSFLAVALEALAIVVEALAITLGIVMPKYFL
jgi:hypothetical protein